MVGFISFPRILVLCEIQRALLRIWTQITESIPCDKYHYTTHTFTYKCIYTQAVVYILTSTFIHIYIHAFIYTHTHTHTHTHIYCPVSWGCRIHWLHLCRAVRPLNECPRYDTKQSDGEVSVMLEPWGMRSTPLFPSLPGPLWPRMWAPERDQSMG